MREILFKAKRTDNGEWVEGYYAFIDGVHYIYTGALCNGGLYVVAERFEVDPETICRYTGSTDKNGKKIWENDIVREFAECDELAKKLYFCYQIIWDKEYCAFAGCDIRTKEVAKFSDLGEIEVIINVFDNPEILEQEVYR